MFKNAVLSTIFVGISSLAVAQTSTTSTPAGAGAVGGGKHPCAADRAAKHQAHMALHQCIEAWAKDGRPNSPTPSDDCSGKLSAFVQAAQTLKQCHQANQHGKHGASATPATSSTSTN